MSVGKWIAFGLVALPAAELVTFVLVAASIGFGPALALVIATSLFGIAVLRRQGRARLDALRASASGAGLGTGFAGDDAIATIGAILLVLPGFITDIVGFLLLVPKVRQVLGATIRRAGGADRPQGRPAGASGPVIDLAPDEWRRVGEPEPPRRERNREP